MDYTILEKDLNYRFNDPSLLQQALTHRSVSHCNNERLEYLGDAILNCTIAIALYQQFPEANEGELSRLRASIVKQDSLADIARDFDLGNFLRLGPGELKSGGYRRDSILADTVEAIIAAIYIDSSIEICQEHIRTWFNTKLNNATITLGQKDAKTQLQEYCQARKMDLPVYTVLSTEGESHEQIFHVQCTLSDLQRQAQGSGSSRRAAEQVAAEMLLREL